MVDLVNKRACVFWLLTYSFFFWSSSSSLVNSWIKQRCSCMHMQQDLWPVRRRRCVCDSVSHAGRSEYIRTEFPGCSGPFVYFGYFCFPLLLATLSLFNLFTLSILLSMFLINCRNINLTKFGLCTGVSRHISSVYRFVHFEHQKNCNNLFGMKGALASLTLTYMAELHFRRTLFV
jgi:hypothetical protein